MLGTAAPTVAAAPRRARIEEFEARVLFSADSPLAGLHDPQAPAEVRLISESSAQAQPDDNTKKWQSIQTAIYDVIR